MKFLHRVARVSDEFLLDSDEFQFQVKRSLFKILGEAIEKACLPRLYGPVTMLTTPLGHYTYLTNLLTCCMDSS